MLCLALFALIGLVGFVLEQRRAVEPIMPLHLFRHRTFVLAGLIGFIVGVSLFGAVTFLPLYMQVVKNATPTSAGLQMLPLMGGLLVVSAVTGRLISRWGRYRVFPIIGTLLQVIALGLLSRLQLDTPMALMNLYMGLLGGGLGMVMQVLILAVQNSVELRHMGVATSGATLFRSIGGAIGVSLFGALFSHSLLGGLGSDFAASAGGAASLSPAAVHALPTALQHSYLQAFSGATHGVFPAGRGDHQRGFRTVLAAARGAAAQGHPGVNIGRQAFRQMASSYPERHCPALPRPVCAGWPGAHLPGW